MKFTYKAKTYSGETKYATVYAETEEQVVSQIREIGLIPVNISHQKEHLYYLKKIFDAIFNFSVPQKSKSIIFRQISVLLSSGISIEKSVELLKEQKSNRKLRKALDNLLDDIRVGKSIAESLEEQNVFNELEVAFIRTGEETGRLDKTLLQLAKLLKKEIMQHTKVITALSYPIVIICVTFAVLLLMTVFVMPQFEVTFRQMNIEMPLYTEIVFSLGRFLRHFWYILPTAIGIFILIVRFLKRYEVFEKFIDRLKLRIPLYGNLLLLSSLTRAFRALGFLLESGVKMIRAIELAAVASANLEIKDIFISMSISVQDGSSLYNILGKVKMFPSTIAQLIRVGEASGHLDKKCAELADICEDELNEVIERINIILEPILIIFVSMIVAAILFAAYMPILSAIKSLM